MSLPEKQLDCALLSMPAEIRNGIYELVFAPETDPNAEVDILDPAPPPTALLRTCRQIRREAKGIHAILTRNYWNTTHFVIDLDCTDRSHFAGIREKLLRTLPDNVTDVSVQPRILQLTLLQKGRHRVMKRLVEITLDKRGLLDYVMEIEKRFMAGGLL